MSAIIVSIDGPDFSGKTTITNLVLEMLRRKLKGKNIMIKKTEVPSTNLITGSFTTILRNSSDKVISEEYALVYALDHLHHYINIIKPMIESEKKYLVIMERSLLSTFIYQGLLGNVDMKWLKEINKYCKTKPNLTIVLKVPLNEIIRRLRIEKKGSDKFEKESFVRKQVEVYYNLPKELVKEFNVKYFETVGDPLEIAENIARMIINTFNIDD